MDRFLLTRFSAVLPPDASSPGEVWLNYRLGFFVDACLPSVLSQREARPIERLVLLDDRSSAAFREDVEKLAEGAFTPILSKEPFQRDSFAGAVAGRGHAPYVISADR